MYSCLCVWHLYTECIFCIGYISPIVFIVVSASTLSIIHIKFIMYVTFYIRWYSFIVDDYARQFKSF